MNYDERRALIRRDREAYGSQWKRHLDRYGLPAYFYELAGIVGRLESLIIETDDHVPPEVPNDVVIEAIEDKLLDLGNYASFMFNWIQQKKVQQADEEFRSRLP